MRDSELYSKLLGIEAPWKVRDVDVRLEAGEVEVFIEHTGSKLTCPTCGAKCAGYDTRARTWRHLDTMQFRTLLTADVPRVACDEHGVKQVHVPWSEPGSRFTALVSVRVNAPWKSNFLVPDYEKLGLRGTKEDGDRDSGACRAQVVDPGRATRAPGSGAKRAVDPRLCA